LTNARVHGFEADFYWPALGVVVEVQSHRLHLTKGALERDTRTAAKLTAAGLTVSYVTWVQMEREPLAVVARTAQLLARAGTPPPAAPPGRSPARSPAARCRARSWRSARRAGSRPPIC